MDDLTHGANTVRRSKGTGPNREWWWVPGRCDQLLQEGVSRDEGCLSTHGSGLLLHRIFVTGREFLTGGDRIGSYSMLPKVLTNKGFM